MGMDSNRLTEYISKFGNTVYRVAYNFVKNAADSEDIVQEIFIKLYRTDRQFDGEEHVKAWLIRAAANMAKNHVRSPWVSRREALDEDIPAPESGNDSAELNRAMSALDKKYGIVIYLHYYEGYAVREIAELLGLTEGNVKVRLKRGREKLKAFLTENT